MSQTCTGRTKFNIVRISGESYLACGLASGEVVIVHVQQILQASVPASFFSPAFRVQIELHVLDALPDRSAGRGMTALAWVDRPELRPEEVFSF